MTFAREKTKMSKTFCNLLISICLVLGFAGCTNLTSNESENESAQSSLGKTFLPGLIRQSQVLPALSKCLGLSVSELSTETKQRYKSLKDNLSEEGNINDLSGPLLMAVTQIAGDVCDDLIRKESQVITKKFLVGFDLSSDVVTGTVNLLNTIEQITKSCWGRRASDSEKALIVNTFANTELRNNRGKQGALFLCTALMSSPDVILY